MATPLRPQTWNLLAEQVFVRIRAISTSWSTASVTPFKLQLPRCPMGGPPAMSEDDWHRIIDLNLTEAFQGCRASAPTSWKGGRVR